MHNVIKVAVRSLGIFGAMSRPVKDMIGLACVTSEDIANPPSSAARSSSVTDQGYMNVNSWLMFAQYAACFGVELTVNNVAATYFSDEFGLSTSKAGLVAALFGLMNLFARSLGGIWSGEKCRLSIRGR